MPMKQKQKQSYQTFQGKKIDMDTLRQRNELTPAVGNARVNARGDELGPGGKIIKKREDVLRDFYEDNVAPTQFEASEKAPVVEEPTVEATEVETPKARSTKAKTGQTKAEAKEEADDWVEDADGNFVQRGD